MEGSLRMISAAVAASLLVLLGVLIVRRECIVDIGQMGPGALAHILSNTGTPT